MMNMICIRYKEALSSPAPPSPEEEIDRGDRSYFHYITPFGRSVGRSLVRPSSRAVARNRADICLLSLSLSLSLSPNIQHSQGFVPFFHSSSSLLRASFMHGRSLKSNPHFGLRFFGSSFCYTLALLFGESSGFILILP